MNIFPGEKEEKNPLIIRNIIYLNKAEPLCHCAAVLGINLNIYIDETELNRGANTGSQDLSSHKSKIMHPIS